MKPSVKQALIASVIAIAYSLILYITNLTRTDYEPYLRWVGFVVLVVFMILAMREQKKLDGGFITYGKAFTTGLIYFIVASVVLTVFTYFYFTSIDPEIVQFMLDKQQQKFDDMGTMTQEQIDQAMTMTAKFMTPTMMCVFSLLFDILMGTIVSLIAAAFIKKDKDPFSEPEARSESSAV